MKKVIAIFAAVIMIVGMVGTSYAQGTGQSASQVTTGAAHIVTPISITNGGTKMNFGSMVSNNTAGTCVLTPAGVRSATGGITTLSQQTGAGPVQVPTYTVTGTGNAVYTITYPPSFNVYLGGSTSAASMAVDPVTISKTGPYSLTSGGTDTFSLGGTLNVPDSPTGGEYSGTFTVTVAYN